MPWPSGSIPVMNVDHATGLCGGVVVCSGLKSPWRRSRSRLGSAFQCCWTNCGSIPSTPRTITRRPDACEPETPQPAASTSTGSRKYAGENLRKAENRFPFHPGRRLDAEQLERRGRHIFDAWIFRLHLKVGKQNSRDQQRIDAMIAAPGFFVVFEDAPADLSDSGFPRRAVTCRVAQNKVRRR